MELALAAEEEGNLPIGAVIALDGRIIAEGGNRTLSPVAHPGRHAEMLALSAIPDDLLPRVPEMTCFTTLEPCVMCFGALVQHKVSRVLFGARDPRGGAASMLAHLPPDVAAEIAAIRWIGPVWPEVCQPLSQRAEAIYWASASRP